MNTTSMTKELTSKYGRVSEPYWDEVWIIGGGSSAKKFDVGRLTGKNVLAVNDAVYTLVEKSKPVLEGPRAPRLLAYDLSIFSLDNDWVRRNAWLLSHSDSLFKERYVALPLETWPDCAGIRGVTYLQWRHEDGLSYDPAFVCTGGNSGYAAINIAFLKGARKIHLVGYDMDPKDNSEYRFWAKAFDTMLPQLHMYKVSVVNHNLDSFINAFPKEC